jgi:hypothetical protein
MKTKKAAAIKKAAPVKKATTAKKATTVKKATPIKKAVIKKTALSKKAVSVRKAVPIRKTATKKKVATKSAAILVESRHIIAKSLGRAMVEKFTIAKSNINGIIFNDGIEFDRDLFEQVLNLPGCVKVRCYNALDTTNGEHALVITGVDAKKNDIYFNYKKVIISKKGKDEDEDPNGEGVGDMGDACPRYEPLVKTLV